MKEMKRIALMLPIALAALLSLLSHCPQHEASAPPDGDTYPQYYFQSPLGIGLSTSATFGEIRPNHFHSGLDLRTGGEIGQDVYAVAEGYVSRVKVSPWGGGKTLYIDHPNGFRSVYMHLNDFCGDIAAWVNDYQYGHHCYAFDTNVAPGLLPVYKGQVVAHSGNSGSSGGPHLHFEIRHAHNDQTVNAQLFGIPVPDGVSPVLKGIRIYPADERALINGKNQPLDLIVQQRAKKGKKTRTTTLEPTVSGAFYMGIYTTDHSETYNGNNGVYRINLFIDDNLAWHFEAESVLFEDTRAVNAIIDYPHYRDHRQPYLLTRLLPHAPVTFSHPADGDGIFRLSAGKHKLRYDIYDYQGNTTSKTLNITVAASPDKQQPAVGSRKPARRREQSLSTSQFQLHVPAEALYDDDSVACSVAGGRVSVGPSQGGVKSMPPHVAYTLRLPVGMAAGMRYADARQLFIMHDGGRRQMPQATMVNGEWLEAHPRDFGLFYVAVDTVPPTVKAVSKMQAVPERTLKLRIADNLSGVETYNCYLNGRWILAEYDGKNATLAIRLPESNSPYGRPALKPSGNVLSAVITDACGNSVVKDFELK